MSLTRSKAVLELGKRLVAQLDVEDDFLASWMAHDVAQRIDAAEKAPANAEAPARDACAKAILELWQRRSVLPSHLRPFRELDPVLRTLTSLDPDQTDHRYYAAALREAATADTAEETKQWLDLAIGLDHAARLLIQFALRTAVHCAATDAEPWVELAREAGADARPEDTVIRFILEKDGTARIEQTDKSGQDDALRDKLSRLESFADAAASLANELRSQLDPGKGAQD